MRPTRFLPGKTASTLPKHVDSNTANVSSWFSDLKLIYRPVSTLISIRIHAPRLCSQRSISFASNSIVSVVSLVVHPQIKLHLLHLTRSTVTSAHYFILGFRVVCLSTPSNPSIFILKMLSMHFNNTLLSLVGNSMLTLSTGGIDFGHVCNTCVYAIIPTYPEAYLYMITGPFLPYSGTHSRLSWAWMPLATMSKVTNKSLETYMAPWQNVAGFSSSEKIYYTRIVFYIYLC
jgi:hypothetical protein